MGSNFWTDVLYQLDANAARMGTARVREFVAQLATCQALRFYEIPRLRYEHGVSGLGRRYGFMRGPTLLPRVRYRTPHRIVSRAKAQALVSSLDLRHTSLYRVFRCAGYDDMNWSSPELVTPQTLIDARYSANTCLRAAPWRLLEFMIGWAPTVF